MRQRGDGVGVHPCITVMERARLANAGPRVRDGGGLGYPTLRQPCGKMIEWAKLAGAKPLSEMMKGPRWLRHRH